MAKTFEPVSPKKESGGSSKEDAARDLIDAIKEDDAKGAALAFAALYELCVAKAAKEY
jgi:hypothetical protein